MPATIDGFGVLRGDILLSARGVWTADIEPSDDATTAKGQRVSIVLGDLTLSGTVVDGTMGIANSSFFIVGGAGGWRSALARRAYQDDKGVRLADVLRDLAQEAGESVSLDSSLSAVVLGASWVRPEGTGADALDALGQPWRVRPDGVTHVGPLALSQPGGLVSMRRYLASIGRAFVDFAEDEIAAVMPGAEVDMGEVVMTVGVARILVTADTLRAELDPMSRVELARAAVDRSARAARLFGFYLYEIAADEHGRASLRRIGEAGGFPDLPGKIDKLYGSHGLSCVSTPGSRVLVGFEGGSPARPFVPHYLGDVLPKSMLLDATEEIQIITTPDPGIGGGDHGGKHVYVGTHDRHAVARETDPVASGVLSFAPGAGIVTITYTPQGGTTQAIGTLAATSLVFTPDPSTGGLVQIAGKITAGSELFSSE